MSSATAKGLLTLGIGLIGLGGYYLYSILRGPRRASGLDNSKNSKPKQQTPEEQIAQLKKTGNHNFSRKNYDVAIENYTKGIDFIQTLAEDCIKPEELAVFYQNRAACNEALGDFEKVISDCDRAIELNNKYVKAFVRRAKAHHKLEKFDKAMVDAYAANLLDQFQNQANMLLTNNILVASSKVKASEAMKKHKPTWPSNQIIKAYFSAFTQDPVKDKLNGFNPADLKDLQAIYDEALKPQNDDDPLSLLVRGSCHSLMNEMPEAQKAFDRLLELDDSICSAQYKSNALIKKSAIVVNEPSSASNIEKDLELVNELLEKAIKIDPENPDIYLHKGQALALGEKLEDAVETLKRAIELKSNFYSAIAQKFYIEFKAATRNSAIDSRKLQELIDQFKEAVKASPNSPELHQMYAQVLTEMNCFEQADQVLSDLAKLDPNDGNIYCSKALLQFQLQNDPEEVANLLREALRIDPKILFAYEILGSLLTQSGKIDEAIKIFETALDYAQSEAEYSRCYNLLDSACSQKAAAELLGMQM